MILPVGDWLSDGGFWRVLGETYESAMPPVLMIGVVSSVVLLAIYINSQSVALTAITAMLSGGVIVKFLPPVVRFRVYAHPLRGRSSRVVDLSRATAPRERGACFDCFVWRFVSGSFGGGAGYFWTPAGACAYAHRLKRYTC